MSAQDQPPAPGYWKASDGQWYPPQGGAPAPPAPPAAAEKKKGGCLKYGLIALAVLVVLAVLATMAGGGGGGDGDSADDPSSGSEGAGSEASEAKLFPGRPDAQPGDRERELGQSAQLSGYTVTVTSAQFVQELNPIFTSGYEVTPL